MTQLASRAPDPRPEPPPEPGPDECCQSGCDPCVFDLYWQAYERYEQALTLWEARQTPQAAPG